MITMLPAVQVMQKLRLREETRDVDPDVSVGARCCGYGKTMVARCQQGICGYIGM
jgi:hypothetical protein